jgi:cell division protein FtsA
MGVAAVDIGGGTIDMAIYVEHSIWETLVFRTGGNHITRDIAYGLRVPDAMAEDLKIRYGHARPEEVGADEQIEISGFGEGGVTRVSRGDLCEIVAARVEDQLGLIGQEIRRSGLDGLLPAGLVLTGGTANLRGLRELAAERLRLPVRIGVPRRLLGLTRTISSPIYSTAVGLLQWGLAREATSGEPPMPSGDRLTFWGRLQEWIRNLTP